ncbi:MAG TPA: hypothetical protein VD932_03635 [Aquabacterium sp.]|nr:hypothetical protein [Aquabacterium sp.]
MLETDADRLATIKALDGQLVTPDGGSKFWAVFDAEYVSVLSDPPMESTSPALQCRTSDVESRQIVKDTEIQVGQDLYRVHRHEPDGTGMSVLLMFKQ